MLRFFSKTFLSFVEFIAALFSFKQRPSSHFMQVVLLFASVLLFGSLFTNTTYARGWWVWSPGKDVDDSELSMFGHGYHPKQPIEFSHKLHAGDRKIPCEYCHSSARRSISAGVPPGNTCIGCHKFVQTEAPQVKYITEKYEKNEPVPWIQVHVLPDYVRFSHKVHVLAKDASNKPLLACQDCHGKVEEMTTARQVAPLIMGWCIECHDRKKILADGSKSEHSQAPVTCNTCHF